MVRRRSVELDPGSHPLAPAIIAFNRGNGWYRAVLGRPDQREWIRLSDLSSDREDVARRLSALELAWGGHPGYWAASLIQQVAHPLVSLIAWCFLLGPDLPAMSPDSVWLRQHPQGLFDRVAITGDLAASSTAGPSEAPMEEDLAIKVGIVIVDSLSPLITTIRSVRRVGVTGLWHGLGDLVARTLLGAASALGSVETGIAAAQAVLTRAPDPIRATPQWHKDRASNMWFSMRSVCCLAYTGVSRAYCDTCPLLADDEINRRLASNQAGAV